MKTMDVLIVGCGIIGASIAWRLRARGASVRCLDPHPGDGATHAAAGMLAAVTESTFGEHELARLNVASAKLWPEFAAELEAETGRSVGLRPSGTLTVAFDSGDRQQLRRLLDLQLSWGLDVIEVSPADARQREPGLGPRLSGASWVPHDHQVDPRAVHHALLTALRLRDVDVVQRRAAHVIRDAHGDVVGVVDEAGETHHAGTVVLAAGWASGALGVDVPTRAVKGQVVRVDASTEPAFHLDHVVRGLVQTRSVYLVPRADGEIVIGATSEEQPDDRRPTAGGIFAVLRDARALVPGIDELPVTDVTARARPGSPDNMPLIGPTGVGGLVLATGHYRNGILLAPLTADAVVAHCAGEPMPDVVSAATPSRFTHHHPMAVRAGGPVPPVGVPGHVEGEAR